MDELEQDKEPSQKIANAATFGELRHGRFSMAEREEAAQRLGMSLSDYDAELQMTQSADYSAEIRRRMDELGRFAINEFQLENEGMQKRIEAMANHPQLIREGELENLAAAVDLSLLTAETATIELDSFPSGELQKDRFELTPLVKTHLDDHRPPAELDPAKFTEQLRGTMQAYFDKLSLPERAKIFKDTINGTVLASGMSYYDFKDTPLGGLIMENIQRDLLAVKPTLDRLIKQGLKLGTRPMRQRVKRELGYVPAGM